MATLTRDDLAAVAKTLQLEPAALRAVTLVETGGRGGFLPDGRPRILLERHILWRRLIGRGIDPRPLARARPDLCGEKWDPRRFPYGSEAQQWERVADVIAFGDRVDRTESYAKSAWEACSWGLLQVLGQNYEWCGLPNVNAFKAAQEAGEASQLRTALRMMDRNGALDALRGKRWLRFARIWNGPGQAVFYAGRLYLAYLRARRGA